MMQRPYGPRSLMRTTTVLPFLRLVTRTRVCRRSVRCAAVSAYMLKRSPEAVGPPCCGRPYQEARPSCVDTTRSVGALGVVTRTVLVRGGAEVAHACASAASATTCASLFVRCGKRLLPQLVAGHARSE